MINVVYLKIVRLDNLSLLLNLVSKLFQEQTEKIRRHMKLFAFSECEIKKKNESIATRESE
jgi:hypothetical protein